MDLRIGPSFPPTNHPNIPLASGNQAVRETPKHLTSSGPGGKNWTANRLRFAAGQRTQGMMSVIEIDPQQIRQLLADVYRDESRRVFATLIRLLGDFDLAEEAMHDAFAAAAEQWPREGVPKNP